MPRKHWEGSGLRPVDIYSLSVCTGSMTAAGSPAHLRGGAAAASPLVAIPPGASFPAVGGCLPPTSRLAEKPSILGSLAEFGVRDPPRLRDRETHVSSPPRPGGCPGARPELTLGAGEVWDQLRQM